VQLPPVVEREPVELVVAVAEVQPEWPSPLMVLQAASTPDEHGQAQPAEHLAADQQAAPAVKRYKVRKGDSLTKIARREWNSDAKHLVQLLIEANPQLRKRPDLVFVGQELIIPDPTASPALARSPATVGESEPTLAAADNTPKSSETRKLRWYTIRKRDSLAAIARRFLQDAERWREIAELNQLREPNRILPGMRIRLPVMVVAAQG
jgi:nucleoid-associated protein YgaU